MKKRNNHLVMMKNFVNQIFQGMLNLLYHTGVLVSTNPHYKINYPIIVYPSQVTLLQSRHAGLFVGHTGLKNNIAKGEIIGEVVNAADGEVLQEVTATESGFLFTIREHPLVYPGTPLARIARENMG